MKRRKRLLKWLEEEREMILERLKSKDQISLREGKLYGFLRHLKEKVKRLQEIGGPGTGGLEPENLPFFGGTIETEEEYRISCLGTELFKRYNEAMSCYVEGKFRATIILVGSILEGALRIKLDEWIRKTLGKLICQYKKEKAPIPQEISDEMDYILEIRNDLTHFNLEREHAKELVNLRDGEVLFILDESRFAGDLLEKIKDLDKIVKKKELPSRVAKDFPKNFKKVYEYRKVSLKCIRKLKDILEYLFAD